MNDIITLSILSPNEYALLQFILSIRAQLKKKSRNIEPIFTLPQNYIVAMFGGSLSTLIHSIDKLIELKIIKIVSNNYGECAKYCFNEKAYHDLILRANNNSCILKTGRKKTIQHTTAKHILNYIIGKSIIKNDSK